MKETDNIKTHLDMMLTDRIKEHAVIDTKRHEIHFQVFRLLAGYDEALREIDQLEKDKQELIDKITITKNMISADKQTFENCGRSTKGHFRSLMFFNESGLNDFLEELLK